MSISALSIAELYGRLKSTGSQADWCEVMEIYSELLFRVIPADEVIALQADQLLTTTAERLPTIDGLIAATAVV